MLLKGPFKKVIKNDYHGTPLARMIPTDIIDLPDAPDSTPDYTSPVLLGGSAAVGYMVGSERSHTKAVLLVDAQNNLVESQRVRIDELRLQLDNQKTIPNKDYGHC